MGTRTELDVLDAQQRVFTAQLDLAQSRIDYLLGRLKLAAAADELQEADLRVLQWASCTYRIALGPRAGQKLLTLQSLSARTEPAAPDLCAKAQGFSLNAGLRCAAHQRRELEPLCRYITRPAIANARLSRTRS